MNKIVLSLVTIAIVTSMAWCQGESRGDWSDSLFLLRNILKDLEKETDTAEQYKMYHRAEEIFTMIADVIQGPESAKLKKEMNAAFNRLTPPPEIVDPFRLRFVLRTFRKTSYYWSDPVSEGQFVDFLNQASIDPSAVGDLLYPDGNAIHYDDVSRQFQSEHPDRPLLGVSYTAAKRFCRWLAAKLDVNYKLPGRRFAASLDDPSLSCWIDSAWREEDHERRQARKMFGGRFQTMAIKGKLFGELPEASSPDLTLRLMTSGRQGKRFHLGGPDS